MSAPATCRHCGEQAGSTGSLSGLVHRWGPKDHPFEPLPTAEQSNAVVERMIAAETTILSTPATHPCDACGGRGTAWPCDCEPLDCEHYPAVCPVCLGRGEHPDRMPARDALADAETLQTVGPRDAEATRAWRRLRVTQSDFGRGGPMRIGERVELHLGTDAWMRGDRYGTIVAVVERHGVPTSVRVKMDKSGRVLRLDPSRVEAISRLYDAADDYEASMIEDVAVRAGLVWKCACGWANRPKDRRCDGCKGEPCDTNEKNYR